ncbi:DUF6266 family protein [Chitinophaga ginsengisoli]|uniref:Uncharacterized protein n=1 Tax=Chitinophaga ginsengisoli TaxID=363837 RepID=A0A2P8FQS3_9BACT|nr:DUF6266 family protein [Chitinophaga ginsengisoli]PSL24071.1 hypothetical protein CLV42_11657 [Chitinophaga ginsengisoli]
MARLKKGLLNGFFGAIGNVEGYEQDGQYIIRSRRIQGSQPPSEKQLACREKMRITNQLLSRFSEFVKLGFAKPSKDRSFRAYSAAVAYQLTHAIIGSYPNYEIDYSKLRVAEGPIDTDGLSPSVSLQSNTLLFSWTPAANYPDSTDHVMLLAYAPALKQAVCNLCGAKRRIGQEILELPETWQQQRIETYMAFRGEINRQCSNSIYLGSVFG